MRAEKWPHRRVPPTAIDAGCNGFLGKPIEPATLGARVRCYLEPEAEASSNQAGFPALIDGLSLSSPELESLRRAFLDAALVQSRQLLASLDSHFDAARASRLIYQWVGAARLFRSSAFSATALEMEQLLTDPPWDMIRLRDCLSKLVRQFSDASGAANAPLPDSLVQELTGKRIALIGFLESESERMCRALQRVRALPFLLGIDDSPQIGLFRDCSAAVVFVTPEAARTQWLSHLFSAPPGMPLLLVGGRADLLGLDRAVQSRASQYLIDAWQPEEFLMRLCLALTATGPETNQKSNTAGEYSRGGVSGRNPTSRPEVLIADDDQAIQILLKTVLRNCGMECRVASSGSEAMQILRAHPPDAAILDINMPGLNGFEVLAAIRQEFPAIRVIILTARSAEEDLILGFNLGADDFVVKPFNPQELALRLKRLL